MNNFCGQCSGFENSDDVSDCPFPGNSKDHAACSIFEQRKSGTKKLTADDFPLKVSDEIAAMFQSNRNTNRVITKLIRSLMIASKEELHDPWETVVEEVEGFADFHAELTSNGMCVSYDFVAKKVVIIKVK